MSIQRDSRDSRDSLLIEGRKSYPEAVAAIGEFVRVVESIFQKSLTTGQREKIGSAMRVVLPKPRLLAEPSSDSADGNYAALGVQCRCEKEDCTQCFYLWWYEKKLYLAVSLRFNLQTTARVVYRKLSEQGFKVEADKGKEIYLNRDLKEMDRIDESLQDVTEEWCTMWRGAGGLKQYLQD